MATTKLTLDLPGRPYWSSNDFDYFTTDLKIKMLEFTKKGSTNNMNNYCNRITLWKWLILLSVKWRCLNKLVETKEETKVQQWQFITPTTSILSLSHPQLRCSASVCSFTSSGLKPDQFCSGDHFWFYYTLDSLLSSARNLPGSPHTPSHTTCSDATQYPICEPFSPAVTTVLCIFFCQLHLAHVRTTFTPKCA